MRIDLPEGLHFIFISWFIETCYGAVKNTASQ